MVEMHADETSSSGEVTPEMVKAGLSALTKARRESLPERDLVLAVYERMRAAGDCVSSERVRSFGMETIYNIRSVIEELRQCERRASEHLSMVVEDDT